MQKTTATHLETELPALVSNENTPGIKRKPIATSVPIQAPPVHTVSQKEHGIFQRDCAETLPPRGYVPTQNRSTLSRVQAWWAMLGHRTRILVIVALVCVFILIVGLSAGLSSKSRTQNLPLPSSHGGPYDGDLTYYDPALGACGLTNSGSDAIAAVSHFVFDAVSVGSNPNANPLCGKKIRAKRGNKSIDLTVVDRCTGCQPTDIDVARSVFADLANIDEGRVPVSWSWLEDVPEAATG